MTEEAQAADAIEAIRSFFRRLVTFVSAVVGMALLLAVGAAGLWSYHWFTNPSESELVATVEGFVQAFDDDNPAEQARYIYRELDRQDLGGGERGFRFTLDDANGFGRGGHEPLLRRGRRLRVRRADLQQSREALPIV